MQVRWAADLGYLFRVLVIHMHVQVMLASEVRIAEAALPDVAPQGHLVGLLACKSAGRCPA